MSNANNKKIVNNYQNNKLLDNIIIKFFPDIKKKPVFLKIYNFITKSLNKKNSQKIKSIIINYEELILKPYINSNINTNKILIHNSIGSGGFGNVYKTSNSKILLKIIKQGNSKDKDNKDREFKSLIFHYLLYKYYEKNENIKYLCKLHEFGIIEKNKWYAFMENCGLDLIHKLNNINIDFDTLLKIFYECCKALKIIHDLEYLHLDIKPENFLMKDDQIKIIDFGMVKKNKFITKYSFGTMNYIPNDWLKNSEENKNTTLEYHHDIFSLGCMFIILLYTFIIKKSILMVCPLVIPIKDIPKIDESQIYKYRKEYDINQFNSMCNTIKKKLNKDINRKTNKGKIRKITNIFLLNLIKMMVHPNPEERCNNVNKIIEYLDFIFANNKRINNNTNNTIINNNNI